MCSLQTFDFEFYVFIALQFLRKSVPDGKGDLLHEMAMRIGGFDFDDDFLSLLCFYLEGVFIGAFIEAFVLCFFWDKGLYGFGIYEDVCLADDVQVLQCLCLFLGVFDGGYEVVDLFDEFFFGEFVCHL